MAFALVPLALALVLLAGAYERRRNASNAADHERVAIRPVLSWPLRVKSRIGCAESHEAVLMWPAAWERRRASSR